MPSTTDLRWIKTTYGGYNTCILGYPSYATGSVLANCTGYVHGRWMELLNATSVTLYGGNASGYWNYASGRYDRGQTPRLGAIACWSGGSDSSGHVAIVEAVASDGHSWFRTSNSAYGGSTFYMQYLYESNDYTWSNYTFQGFIYLPMVLDETDIAILAREVKKKVKVNIR